MLCGDKGAFKLNITGTHRFVLADRVRSARIHGVRSEGITPTKAKLKKMVKHCSRLTIRNLHYPCRRIQIHLPNFISDVSRWREKKPTAAGGRNRAMRSSVAA